MRRNTKIFVAVTVIVLLVVLVYWFAIRKKPELLEDKVNTTVY